MRYPSLNTIFTVFVGILLLVVISLPVFSGIKNSPYTNRVLEYLRDNSRSNFTAMDIPIYQYETSLLKELNPLGKRNLWEIATKTPDLSIPINNETVQADISILTQNVWFDTATCLKERYEAIVQQIKSLNPDVVCLQEVIGSMMTILSSNKFIQKTYYMSDSQKLSTFDAWYGIVVLVRKSLLVKFTKLPFPYSRMGRSLICAHLNWRGETGVVASAHFESGDGDVDIRQRQWTDSTEYLLKEDPNFAFMCGDFNIFKDSEETEFLTEKLKWNDPWSQKDAAKEDKDLKRDGITFGIFQPGAKLPVKRLDRILYQNIKAHQVSAVSVNTMGDEPLTTCAFAAPLVIYPSDHLGLVAKFTMSS